LEGKKGESKTTREKEEENIEIIFSLRGKKGSMEFRSTTLLKGEKGEPKGLERARTLTR